MNLKMASKESIAKSNEAFERELCAEHYRMFHKWEEERDRRTVAIFAIGAICGAIAVIAAAIIVNG